MIIIKEYLKSVQPEIKGESDKYSWNIYRYLKKHKGEDIRVFKTSQGTRVMGREYSDGICGCDTRTLMSTSRAQEFWFGHEFSTKELDGWLEKYQRIGRCLLIPHDFVWYIGEDKRFTYVNNTRKCNWCGQWQHKELHKVVKREIREEWRDDK